MNLKKACSLEKQIRNEEAEGQSNKNCNII